MNKNETSLVSHALKLYAMQYDDNIELKYYDDNRFNVVGNRNFQYTYILRIYNGTDYMAYDVICDTLPNFTSLNLNINIRSFINHWIQYFNFNKKINRVAVCKCYHNRFDIKILCDDNRLYNVLISPYSPVEHWVIYNW